MRGFFSYVRRNPALGWGLGILLVLFLFSTVGLVFINRDDAYALATISDLPPKLDREALAKIGEVETLKAKLEQLRLALRPVFGTDSQGKSLLASLVLGTGMTLQIGAIAGAIGIGAGTILGFVSGYYAGSVFDNVVTSIVDVVLTMPAFLILILIASSLTDPSEMEVIEMGLIVSVTAWAFPTRAIRSQVMSMAQSVYGGVMGSLGLQAMGIGDRRQPYLGMTIYWLNYYAAFLRGMWWWILEPVGVIVLLLTSLTLVSFGLDEVANPRVRRRV